MSRIARQGFILQPSYRVQSGRPVIHLWGKLEDGSTFLIRDDRTVAHFYIEARNEVQARCIVEPLPSGRLSMEGESLARVELPLPRDTPAVRDTLERRGIPTFEADVRFAMRYLIDRGIRSSVSVRGEAYKGPGVDWAFENPVLEPADWRPSLSVLSLDIETDPTARRILSVALWGCGVGEVLLLTPEGTGAPDGAKPVASEGALLRALCRRIRELDPDVLTGWNVADFDFAVLLRRAEELGASLAMGRGDGATRLLPGRTARQSSQVVIPGRLVLDGLHLLRTSFIRMERYSLDFVSREVLGEGKTMHGEGRGEAILHAFETDRQRFVDYNLTDARLVVKILEKLDLVELAVQRSLLTGLPVDRVSSSVAAFDFLYMSELRKLNRAAPSVRRGGVEARATSGGHVLEPQPGLYENVIVLDFKSLYPSLIRTFQIDPLGYVAQPEEGVDLIIAANGAAFRRKTGILTGLLDDLTARRDVAKAVKNQVESHAIKILMNSFFGVLGTPVCRFYNPEIANAITSTGRELLLWCKARIERWGFSVLYGDTDSLFVVSGEADSEAASKAGLVLMNRLNHDLSTHVQEKWRVEESRLEIEFEKLYLRLFLPSIRHGSAGARKRYAGLVEGETGPEVVFTGLEAVRRDWTDLAREAQHELYRRFFLGQPVQEYLEKLVEKLNAGSLDEKLIYRKALRKSLDAYVSTTPPHVAAARKLSGPPGRSIRFVMTTSGPEPLEERVSPLDYGHYLERQLRPVAEPILEQLGLDFAKVIGEDRQLDLF